MARAATEEKSFKIGEVCKLADLQPYVLRYWETEFPQLAPGKSGGGQRLYNRREVDIILRIKELLYREGFTIAGAKKRLEQEMSEPVVAAPATPSEVPVAAAVAAPQHDLSKVKQELRALLRMLSD